MVWTHGAEEELRNVRGVGGGAYGWRVHKGCSAGTAISLGQDDAAQFSLSRVACVRSAGTGRAVDPLDVCSTPAYGA